MMPQSMPMPPAPAPESAGPMGAPPAGGAPAPDAQNMRAMLVQVLTKAKSMADEAGISFDDLLGEVMGGEVEMEGGEMGAPMGGPRPPSPSAMAGM